MTLHGKTLLVVGITLASVLGIVALISPSLLLDGYRRVEEAQAQASIRRAQAAVHAVFTEMESRVNDWASWDDTYQFIQDGNPSFRHSNLLTGTNLRNAHTDLMLFMNTNNDIIFGGILDAEDNLISFPKDLMALFQTHTPFSARNSPEGYSGFIFAPIPLLLSARPILTSQRKGPSQGLLVFGRRLKANEIAGFSHLAGFTLDLEPLSALHLSQSETQHLLTNQALITLENEKTLRINITLPDLYGRTQHVLTAQLPREVYQESQRSLKKFLTVLLVTGAAVSVLSIVLLNAFFKQRLDRLGAELRRIGSSGSATGRVSATTQDELAELPQAVNQMLVSLERSESALRQSETRYRAVIEQLSEGLLLADTETHEIIDSNTAAGVLLGVARAEMRHLTLEQVLAAAEDAPLCADMPQFGSYCDFQLRRPNGDIIDLEINVGNIEYDQHQVLCLLLRDVSAQRRAEAAQAKEHALLKTILHTIPDLIWVKDQEGIYLACNPRFERLFGAKEAEIVGKSDYDFVSRELADFFRAKDCAALAAGQPTVNEEELAYADDGHRELLETIKTPMLDARGQIIGVLGIARDITALRHAEAALRESQARYSLMVNNIRDVLFQTDAEGRWSLLNPAWERLTGFSVAQSLGASFLDYVHPADREQNAALFVPLMAREKSHCLHRVRYLMRDGGYRWVEVHAHLTIDSQDRILGTSGTLRDVTELKRAEEALNVSNMRLQVSNQEMQEFVYVASHDLQEPLRKVTTFGERLKEKFAAVLGDNGRDYLERMLSATVRMQTLIEDLLLLSRVTTTAQKPVMVDLNRVMAEVLSDLEIALERTGGQVTSGNLPKLLADPTQIRQLLQNLVGNALKFHKPEQPPQVSVTANEELTQTGVTRWHITITDNGIGFEQSYAEQIFQPFARLHGRSSGYQGTGIGLTVCRKIVLRHHGEIWAEGRPDSGASFHIILPVVSNTEENHE